MIKKATKKPTKKSPPSSPRITKQEGLSLLKNADLLGLGMMADELRKKLHSDNNVSFIVDRNINYTNVCTQTSVSINASSVRFTGRRMILMHTY